MKYVALLALALAAHWMLLSGHTEPLLLAFGILSIAFVIFMARRMYTVDVESHPFELLPRLFGYWLWLLKEIIKSNIDTARRALGPKSLVQPVIINVPARQKTDLGLVIHANSITLTPGTVSLRLGKGDIEVHALHPDVARGTLDSGMDERVPE
jgi:multicomponent Na+:H+ antiporter subunit E